jgi:glycosyltransferase involved in cell wall biosynthesis
MQPKKIIIGITAEGSVNLLLGQLKYYKSLGYQTYLMGPYSERSAKFCKNEGCEHLIIDIEREISPLKDLRTLWTIIKIFRKVKPDIINLGTPKVSLLGMIAGLIVGVKKRIYTCRGFRFEHEKGLIRKILISMEKVTSSLSHKIICISNSVLELGIDNKIFTRAKSLVIHKGSSNGVNLSLFNPEIREYQEVKSKLIQKYNLEESFVFGFLGRIVDRKGINELIEVFIDIYNSNPEVKLLIVGPFEMTQISDKSIVQKINKHPGIINYGRVLQEEVPGFMMVMDVFVLPAWWEGFGNTLVQAAAMGVPVISTTGTGTIDAVSDGCNGILIPVKNKLKLEEAMKKMLNDNKLLKKFGKNGVKWSQNFDREIIWKGIDQIYKGIDLK